MRLPNIYIFNIDLSQSDGEQTPQEINQDITTETAATANTSKLLDAVTEAWTTEVVNTNIICVVVAGVIGFVIGMFVATALLKSRNKWEIINTFNRVLYSSCLSDNINSKKDTA